MIRKGYTSKPPVSEEREVNRLHAEAVKKQNDTAEAAVIANFHRQRVIPFTERNLPIFDLTPEAPCAGSRTSYVLLPRDVAARRAKNAVAEFPDNPEDLWKIKMRPEAGYLSVVSLSFNSLSILRCFLPTSCS